MSGVVAMGRGQRMGYGELPRNLLRAALLLDGEGVTEFTATELRAVLRELGTFPGHGQLYDALHRAEERFLLAVRWESDREWRDRRPGVGGRRRLYRLTLAGRVAASEAGR